MSAEGSAEPTTQRYLSTHLTALRADLGYTRAGYGLRTYLTFGEHLPADRRAAIVEIGPGGCEFAELLATQHGYRNLTLLDREPEVVELAEHLGLRSVLTEDVGAVLQDRAGELDCVMLFHVLEHVVKAQIIPLLSSIRTSLASDGRALVEVPNMGDPFNGAHARYADFTHEVGFTEESLRFVLEQAGFTRIEFLDPVGATGRVTRVVQRTARRVMHAGLRLVSLPNGRQLRRRIDPVLAVVARP